MRLEHTAAPFNAGGGAAGLCYVPRQKAAVRDLPVAQPLGVEKLEKRTRYFPVSVSFYLFLLEGFFFGASFSPLGPTPFFLQKAAMQQVSHRAFLAVHTARP